MKFIALSSLQCVCCILCNNVVHEFPKKYGGKKKKKGFSLLSDDVCGDEEDDESS